MSDEQQPRASGDRIRTGVAGEFLVAGEISKRGWIATLTAKNTPDVDVLAARPEGDSYARIQVKTRTPAYKYAFRLAKVRLTGKRDFSSSSTLAAPTRARGTSSFRQPWWHD